MYISRWGVIRLWLFDSKKIMNRNGRMRL